MALPDFKYSQSKIRYPSEKSLRTLESKNLKYIKFNVHKNDYCLSGCTGGIKAIPDTVN